ncbi:flagellin [Thioclava pacifica]|uniref:Flagellin C-terminal domain-containing protein n=1 Tax=Thioclava pacifica DSM 10166 TaxID=1353537 RepID=A0A074JFH0_9RHOB|nr:flagellin [Thioclava pacifica]KEO54333.1 hypothetical protein TP2_05240 [Thioclava pacifica DSM 10166]
MNYLSVGDMAQSFQMRQHNLQLKTAMAKLTEEVMTGLKQDLGVVVSGDFTSLAGIDRSRSVLDSYDIATSEADLVAGTVQNSLQTIRSLNDGIGVALLSAATTATKPMIDATVNDAATRFDTLISMLNRNVTGRYLFSGGATDTRPLPDSVSILAALSAELAGVTDANDAVARIDDWFDDAAGFSATQYQGSTPQSEFRIAEGETARIEITASDPALRDAMKGIAMAALLSDGLFSGNLEARSSMANAAGARVIEGDDALAGLAAKLGTIEAKIADAAVRNAAERSALEIARNELIGADPYESASALEAVRTQLETLYTLTSRLSSLSMTDYM